MVAAMKTVLLLLAATLTAGISLHAADSIYDVPLKDIDGNSTSLKAYQGRVLLIVNVALGVVSRAAPQLNLYAVGFPVSMMFGLVVLIQALPVLRQSFETLLRESLGHAALLAGAR